MPSDSPLGPFHVHRDHAFEGFTIDKRRGGVMLVARCDCGEALDVADAQFKDCPDCSGTLEKAGPTCTRCAGTGMVVDHGALTWRRR
ncbi:MAG: hypothetical protein H0T12_03705 [Actinobacteria bacterium]|nr:hypothetical protein [Actinomycetota bacterium]